MKVLKVRLTLIEEALGTASNNPEIHREFIASKSPHAKSVEEEVEAVGTDAVVEKGMTVFPRVDGKPFVYDYQVKGFFKDACGMLTRVPGTRSNKVKAYKKIIDGLLFVSPRKIEVLMAGEMGNCQRPLRGSGPQGERVALANSETVPVGSSIAFTVSLLDESHAELVRDWLDYGQLRGLGQWRNSGKGRFTWEELQ